MGRRPKVTIVGAGMVGHTTAHWLAAEELADLVLVDIIEKMPMGKALDLRQALPVRGVDVSIVGSNGYEETAGSDVAVIIAGIARKPGMTREQLLDTNAGIVRSVVEQVVKFSPQAYLIVVTNPLDAMTYLTYKVSGFPRERVIGESGALDATRFRTFIAGEVGVSVEDVQAMVIGAHTDKDMVPLPRFANVGGVPLGHLIGPERIDAIVARTRRGGAEITELMGSSAFFAPGAAIAQMVEAILRDKKRLLACSVYLDGEYGERDVCIGVPVVLGGGGVERIIELPLDDQERAAFKASVAAVREHIGALKL
ncbi:MAG: malate dehydrogenase [Armatimonadota bacterium]|nr:malate dehydrogenase [Armatimonadota bacterium]MDR7452197.1 malate dehydrogenase [Armatimonadota bacterium]MDR7468036.1 malate dehydrogenase [Armatimonadota bacterium]MDR7494923.1 malate dehydrogenase [Armatimonadota bacterium]MDR7500373.1 malate dehydrogenase [Armatimonadota bacterium]